MIPRIVYLLLISVFLIRNTISQGEFIYYEEVVEESDIVTNSSVAYKAENYGDPALFTPRPNNFQNPDEHNYTEKITGWSCSSSETEKQYELRTTNEMMKQGENLFKTENKEIENTILVLGNAGAGKTSFIHFMAGNQTTLRSQEVGNGTGEYILVDGSKIGTSPTESLTLYPERYNYSFGNTTLTDTPGFSDTRSLKHEVVTMLSLKLYMMNIKNIKIALFITYNSLQFGVYKDDFVKLLRNVCKFITDVKKYSKSIVLIASKVPTSFKIVDNKPQLVSDHVILINVADFITKVKLSLTEKLQNGIEPKENKFIKNAVVIIDRFLETDRKGNYKNINLFKRPTQSGPVSEIKLLQNSKGSFNIMFNNTNYTRIFHDDIDFNLSPNAENYLNCLITYLNENATKIFSRTFLMMKKEYEIKIQNYTNIYQSSKELHNITNSMTKLSTDLCNSCGISNYINILEKFMSKENLSGCMDKRIYELKPVIYDFQRYTGNERLVSMEKWTQQLKPLKDFVDNEYMWYNFLLKLFEYYSSYSMQSTKMKLINETNDTMSILSNSNLSVFNYFNPNFNSIKNLDDNSYKELDSAISITMQMRNVITCDRKGMLNITGYFIKTSEINSEEIVKKYCGNITLETVGIFAAYKLFIDSDINNEIFHGIDVIIIAPIWEIIGEREINIRGLAGEKFLNPTANDGINFGQNGENGRPGNPGRNGGNFIGIGIDFINEENLTITTTGGEGGPGQNGGNGQVGVSGKEGYQKFYDIEPNDGNYNESWEDGRELFPFKEDKEQTRDIEKINKYNERVSSFPFHTCFVTNQLYYHYGDCGSDGGKGGSGGIGGIGGYPGIVQLIGETTSPKFKVNNSKGPAGINGQSGKSGKKGKSGQTIVCLKTILATNTVQIWDKDQPPKNDKRSIWNCVTFSDVSARCVEYSTEYVETLPKLNDWSINEPNLNYLHNYSSYIYNYLIFLENEKNIFIFDKVKEFRKIILDKIQTNRYLTFK